jgi:hypothetical protein
VAAGALAKAINNDRNQVAIRESSGIEVLVARLRGHGWSGNDDEKESAACALKNLGIDPNDSAQLAVRSFAMTRNRRC